MNLQHIIGIKEAIQKIIVERAHLSPHEAYGAMQDILSGNATPAQIGAFLAALKMHEPGTAEVAALVRCMKDNASMIDPAPGRPVVDTCGTGGDSLKTVNISTLSALVAAGAGVVVAKHGNRCVTSQCGSADVLEHFGLNLMAPPAVVERSIRENGIGFLFAPVFHPAMKHAAGPRKEIGLRTIFNVLGPLTNPSRATGQVLGVYDVSIAPLVASVLSEGGARRFYIVHNEHDADELLPSGRNHVFEGRAGVEPVHRVLLARDFGLREASLHDIPAPLGKEPGLDMFSRLLSGNGPEALVHAVLMNSALAIMAGEVTNDILKATRLARASIETGAAREKLRQLVSASEGSVARCDLLAGGT